MSVFDNLKPCSRCGSSDLCVTRDNSVECRFCGLGGSLEHWNTLSRPGDELGKKLAAAEAEIERLSKIIDGEHGELVAGEHNWEVRQSSRGSHIMFRCGGYHRWLRQEEALAMYLELGAVLKVPHVGILNAADKMATQAAETIEVVECDEVELNTTAEKLRQRVLNYNFVRFGQA
jgi:hypothetical protein